MTKHTPAPESASGSRFVRTIQWLEKYKFTLSLIINIGMLFMFIVGAVGMICFIYEETLQAQGFGYAILMMNKEWEDAYGVIREEEQYIRATIAAIRNTWNPITGRAFRAYASAVERKLTRDKAFCIKMMKQQQQDRYLAKWNR